MNKTSGIMKTKYYAMNLPMHLKKYVERKFEMDIRGNLKVNRISSFGEFINFGLRVVPFPAVKKFDAAKPFIKIRYFDETFSNFLPNDADTQIIRFLDRLFREELINYVAGCHEADGKDYTKYVWKFLDRYGIIRDEDIESETARKIYRDFLGNTLKINQKYFSRLSANKAICPQIQ